MSPSRRSSATRTASAFAPSHLTGIFAPELSPRDPRARGSVGAGLVLEVGVTARATFVPGARRTLRVRAGRVTTLPISTEVAERLSAGARGALTVELEHALPIGQGFGASAAGALATGLAVAELFGRPKSEAVETAHLAELFLGGGLGGVAAILGGGLELRTRTGVPPWGRVLHAPFPHPILLSVLGRPVPSPRLLGDPRFLERVRVAAESGLRRLGGRPEAGRFLDASEEFTDTLGLAPPAVLRAIRALRRAGGRTAQAMFGSALFSVPTTAAARRAVVRELERRGLYAVELRAGTRGAGRSRRVVRRAAGESLLPRGRVGTGP